MIKVNVFADNKNRKHKIKNPILYIKKKVQRLKKYYFFKNKNIEFSILLTGNDVIKKLNKIVINTYLVVVRNEVLYGWSWVTEPRNILNFISFDFVW